MITVVVHLFCTIFSAQRGCDTTKNFCNEMHILLMIYNLDFPSIEEESYYQCGSISSCISFKYSGIMVVYEFV